MYRNDYDSKGDCSLRGEHAENEFVKAAHKRHYKIQKATREQQYTHIDYILKGLHPTTRQEISVTVDRQRKKETQPQGKIY